MRNYQLAYLGEVDGAASNKEVRLFNNSPTYALRWTVMVVEQQHGMCVLLLNRSRSIHNRASRCEWLLDHCPSVEMEKVINCFKKRPDAVTRLICFPWAGGGSIHYARWGNVLSSSIEGNTLTQVTHILEDVVKHFALHLCCLLYIHNFSNV